MREVSSAPVAQTYRRLARTLLLFSVPSIIVGVLLAALGEEFWFGFGLQAALWGAIDVVLVAAGRRKTLRRAEREGVGPALRRLRRTLRLNGFMDVGYIVAGLLLCGLWGVRSRVVLGHGVGVVVQGGFLLVFDFYFSAVVSRRLSSVGETDRGGLGNEGSRT